MKKISIIIPVYNAALYIERCINSLLTQTLQEIEILIIDDKGKDDSIAIVEQLIQNHPRKKQVTIITMEKNSGAATARNTGLKHATGEYIAFVDADDWCEPDMFELLYLEAKKHNADWCYGNALKHYENGKTTSLRQNHFPANSCSIETKKTILTQFVALFWTGIYKNAHLKKYKIGFPASKFSEDSYFVWMNVVTAQSITSVDRDLYHYWVHSNSVSTIPDPTKSAQKIKLFNTLIEKLTSLDLYLPFKEEVDYLCLKKGYIIAMLVEAINNKKGYKENIANIITLLDQQFSNYTSNSYYSKDFALCCIMFMLRRMPFVLAFILRLKFKRDPF